MSLATDWLALLRGQYYRLRLALLSGGRVRIGHDFRAYGPLLVRGMGRISIGDGVRVGRDPFGRYPVCLHTMHSAEAEISIADGVSLAGTRIAAGKRVRIERGARLADALIMDSDFHEVASERRLLDSVGDAREVIVGQAATVGSAALLTKGCTVGDGSTVRPGAVVMRPTPPRAVLSGYPARPERVPAPERPRSPAPPGRPSRPGPRDA